ncbi:MAG TPA: ABC transporter ATP-binding protein [Longimicrobiales bacterium]|nr:ABC transporter ATP-binding protein [Longimicrobiales bacterium]
MRFSTRDLTVRYAQGGRAALDGVSINVPDGSLYAVLGPNGSGKSTLMKALLGVLPSAAGVVEVDGRPVSTWSRRGLAQVVGVVAQSETIAFPLKVREMVAMGRYPHLGALGSEREADRMAIARALDRCDVSDLAERDVMTLSGGELQRVRIARALAQEPRALVLDEPTASLDIRHEMAILELLRSSADAGMTVLVVTHGLDLAGRFADRMLLLSKGRLAAEGVPAEVMRSEVLEEVYHWPVAVGEDPATGTPRVTPLRLPSPPL